MWQGRASILFYLIGPGRNLVSSPKCDLLVFHTLYHTNKEFITLERVSVSELNASEYLSQVLHDTAGLESKVSSE